MDSNKESRKRVEYVISVVVARIGKPQTYDFIFEKVEDVICIMRENNDEDEVEIPAIHDFGGNPSSLYNEAFSGLSSRHIVGQYHPENVINQRSSVKNKYVISRKGIPFLLKPPERINGLNPQFTQAVRSAAQQEFGLSVQDNSS